MGPLASFALSCSTISVTIGSFFAAEYAVDADVLGRLRWIAHLRPRLNAGTVGAARAPRAQPAAAPVTAEQAPVSA